MVRKLIAWWSGVRERKFRAEMAQRIREDGDRLAPITLLPRRRR